MSALVAHLLTFQRQLAIELQRFWLLWRYQYRVPPYTLWWRLVLKRIFDVGAVLIGVVIVAPILVLVALAVKWTSPGPSIYYQERVGRFGDVFKIYKFRTMVMDAEASGPVWASRDSDPRVTPIGTFLRQSHLDELPQLFNILKGDMSLVGPRPERPHFVERLDREIPRYDERLLIKPGLTGLAQVHVRSDQSIADVKKKLRFDRFYIKRMCLRQSHIDELPQLFNILKGDMSLVGPRPERPHFVERLDREIPRYDERLLIKPGLTGLAQVHVRSDQSIADVKKKLRFDQFYIKRMCLALDAKILVWTALMLLTGREVRTEL